jgi:glucose/arabinose dehydrogenase
VVRSFEVSSADANVADTSKGSVLITIPQPESNHNGGMLAFGPDGCLFVGMGDGGGGNDLHGPAPGYPGNGQNLDTMSGSLDPRLGKLLRFDVDAPTTGAPGNLTGAATPHIWDWGLRNPWRFSFDRKTGDLYIGDVGQDTIEEIDVEPAGTGQRNYGWKITEGSICRGGGSCSMTGLTAPVFDYNHAGGDNCVVGGYVYRGAAITALQGFYVFADYGSKNVRAFVWDGSGRCNSETVLLTSQLTNISGSITSFGEDSAGELYITSFGPNGTDGRLYRIDAN